MVFFVVSSLLPTALSLLTRRFRPLAGFEVVASEAATLAVAAVFALVVLAGTEDIEGTSFARELVLVDWAIGLDAMVVANESEWSTRHCQHHAMPRVSHGIVANPLVT